MKQAEQATGKAIVIGGGFAGILTARVLSDYYAEVLVIEKDEYPEKPEERSGIPQAFHPHRFTDRGKQITDRLFPGYEEEMIAGGARSVRNKNLYFLNPYGSLEMQNPEDDLKFSRALLEWVLRRRVNNISNVRFLPKHDVVSLLTNAERTAVTGVRISERSGLRRERELAAELVVEAGGRGSKLSAWLTELGYSVPEPNRLQLSLGYSTRRYHIPSHLAHLAEMWDTIHISGQPAEGTLGGVFSSIENNIAELVLSRPGGQYPPVNAEEFEQAVAELPSKLIADIVQQLEPVAAPRAYRIPELYCHFYEQMDRWPSGLLVIGDAYCIYDPVFGQGMTVAAIEAEMLESSLRERQTECKPDFEQRFHQSIKRVIETAWWFNCAADLQWERVEYAGPRPLKGIDFGCRYLDLFLRYATERGDLMLYGLYWGVNSLGIPPSFIFNPETAAAVLEATEEGKRLLAELAAEGEELASALFRILPEHFIMDDESAKEWAAIVPDERKSTAPNPG